MVYGICDDIRDSPSDDEERILYLTVIDLSNAHNSRNNWVETYIRQKRTLL
jgi:hypothetical protein